MSKNNLRHIPATMATQHPDNAHAPYWETDGDGYISASEEVTECFSAFADLGCEEFMWDWEGKYVDEAVVDRLFQKYYEFFKEKQLGKDIFLTFRVPNIWQEPGHSLSRALMGILTAEQYARDLKLHEPPLFEVILPMVVSAEQIIHTQKTFEQMAILQKKLFKNKSKIDYLRVLPLFERVEDMLNAKKILDRYIDMHQKEFDKKPDYLRLHIARSDPAINSGHIPAVLGAKVAISLFYKFEKEKRIKVFPAIGVGSLPFRGGLNPLSIPEFLKEFPGIRTAYIQSAFRYDYPLSAVKKAIKELNNKLPKTAPVIYSEKETNELKTLCKIFITPYRETIKEIAPFIDRLAREVPSRRERKLHIGLFGYSRSIGKKRLPRAIHFTAVMYSLGIPPEIIGTGRGLKSARDRELDLEKYFPSFRSNMKKIGRYFNPENLEMLAKEDSVWRGVQKDVKYLEEILGFKLGPVKNEDFLYKNGTSNVYYLKKMKKSIKEEISKLGHMRKSLG